MNTATEYRIVPGAGIGDLSAHVNHRMQFTGTVAPRPGRGGDGRSGDGGRARGGDAQRSASRGETRSGDARGSGDSTAARSGGSTDTPGAAGQGRGRGGAMTDLATLNVTSMTMVAASCQ
jgi:hypothetical protein